MFILATLAVIVVIGALFVGNMQQNKRDAIVLPDAAQSTQPELQPDENEPALLEVTRENVQSIVRSLSGFDASALRVYESGSRSRPVWQFAWYAASDEGGRLYRCKVISEGAHCYALTFSAPEGSGTAYDTTAAELFSSMELQPA